MKNMHKLGLCGALGILIFSLSSCSSPANWFATATPSPTNTPTLTFTPTPTNTPTLTATPTITDTLKPRPTPVSPVTLTGCTYWACPPSKTIQDILGNSYGKNAQFDKVKVNIASTDAIHFYISYCARTKAILDENLPKIQFFYYIDGFSYSESLKGENYTAYTTQHPSVLASCYEMDVVASGWKTGQSHLVSIGLRFLAPVNNGWDAYIAGLSYPNIYNILPSDPTPTPLAPAGKPVPVPPAVNCMVNSNIIISNKSGAAFTLYLSGPGNFVFNLGADEYSTVKVCSGSYTYTIQGTCSGKPASGSGQISDGDQVSFVCRSG
jgi:hypothetical protein